MFFVRTKLGCVVFFSWKNTNSRRQEKQNTEDILKNHVFFDVRSFLEAANLTEVLVKKFGAQSVQPLSKNWF
jgi:hypothetical protein